MVHQEHESWRQCAAELRGEFFPVPLDIVNLTSFAFPCSQQQFWPLHGIRQVKSLAASYATMRATIGNAKNVVKQAAARSFSAKSRKLVGPCRL
jgi:hypothetical protein